MRNICCFFKNLFIVTDKGDIFFPPGFFYLAKLSLSNYSRSDFFFNLRGWRFPVLVINVEGPFPLPPRAPARKFPFPFLSEAFL